MPLNFRVAKLLSAAVLAEKFYVSELEAIGPCDHDVNICVCGIYTELGDLREAIALFPKEAK